MELIAKTQSTGRVCAVIDTAAKLDTSELAAAGVNLDDLLVSQPESAEQAAEIIDTLIHTGAIDLIVADCCATVAMQALRRGRGSSTALMLIPGVWS